MAGAGYKNESYAKLGMGRFTSWFRPEGMPPQKRPADVDGVLHDAKTNRFIMFEFKPANRGADNSIELTEPTQGQQITLRGFSRLPGCMSVLIFDLGWNREVAQYKDEQPVVIWVWKNGERTVRETTLEKLNAMISRWYAERELPFGDVGAGAPA